MTKLHASSTNNKPLTQASLHDLPSNVDIPLYDRSQLKAGIVHIGVGGFHRAHQAYYTNELLKSPGSEQWAICGVGLMEANRTLSDILKKQDYLYTLTVRHPNGDIDHKVIGSMIDFLLAPDNKQAVIDKMAHDDTKIVSLTITEGGYHFHPSSGEFDVDNPEIQHDIAHPLDPKTAFGYITAALKLRMDAGNPAFTVQSCDNIQHNGNVTRKMLLSFAQHQDPSLCQWMEQHVTFPNAMVDRITPVTQTSDINYVTDKYKIIDEWPITCEAFTQWVIEDSFCSNRPHWDKVGAQFVVDVTPYEKMKIRLLNAGHSVLGLLGSLHGYHYIDETVSDPIFAKYLRAFMDYEVSPLLEPLDGIDIEVYKDTLIERFANPNVKDSVSRICSQSSAKMPKFVIATINENLQQNNDVSLSALVLAAWCVYSDKGVDEHGNKLEIIDSMQNELHTHAQQTEATPIAFLQISSLFGSLSQHTSFTQTYEEMIKALYAPNSHIRDVMQNVLTQKVK